jgi:hypothetical protein
MLPPPSHREAGNTVRTVSLWRGPVRAPGPPTGDIAVLPSSTPRPLPRSSRWGGLLILGLCLAGCPNPPPYNPAEPPRLELGSGCRFRPLAEGNALALHSGSQGGQHIFVSLRAWNLAQDSNLVDLALTRPSDGVQLGFPYQVRMRFDDGPDDSYELEGLLMQVHNMEDVLDQEVRLTAAIETDSGERAMDEHTGTVRWANDDCD